jgi:PAS domain S-box-containing protein
MKNRVVERRDCFSLFWALGLCEFVCFTIIGILLCAFTASTAAAQEREKNVLLLFSSVERNSRNWEPFDPLVRARVPGQITFYRAYLEVSQEEEKSYLESQAETFRRTYAGVKLDLVIAANPEQLRFAVLYRDKIFPGVPIVFTAVSARELEGQKMWPGVTGVTVPVGLRETIDLALHLHPDTTTVAVITNASSIARYWASVAHAELLRHQDKLRETDLVGPASGQLLERVAALPPHTIVLFQLAPDSSRPAFGALDLLTAVAQRLPTYSPWPSLCLNYGCVGGAYEDWPKERSLVAEMAARILLGERPEDIPIVHASDLQVRVDSRALHRWHISGAALPPGSVLLYMEPTLWERARKYFLAGIAVIAVQALLIFGLLWQRARKRKAEAVLRESEERFRLVANSAPVMIWMSGANKRCVYFNQPWLTFTGRSIDQELGDGWAEGVHPEDLEHCLEIYTQAFDRRQPFDVEFRLRRHDEEYRWIFDYGVPRRNADGSFAGYIGSAIDVTDQKLAREALQRVSGQLIAAQEKERSHLARELHDDICQRLAMLSLRIEKVTRGWSSSQKPVNEQLEEIRQQCSTLAGDVQALSHELHPSILDNLGLVTAVKSFCRELSQQNGAVVDFTDRNIPPSLPREVSLSLFRVIQEALHNSVKYSGGKHFEVRLLGKPREIELEVTDRGVGFDVTSAKRGGGLGLVSMAERIQQVNGTFNIDSQPNAGTQILVRVPLATQPKAMPASAN